MTVALKVKPDSPAIEVRAGAFAKLPMGLELALLAAGGYGAFGGEALLITAQGVDAAMRAASLDAPTCPPIGVEVQAFHPILVVAGPWNALPGGARPQRMAGGERSTFRGEAILIVDAESDARLILGSALPGAVGPLVQGTVGRLEGLNHLEDLAAGVTELEPRAPVDREAATLREPPSEIGDATLSSGVPGDDAAHAGDPPTHEGEEAHANQGTAGP